MATHKDGIICSYGDFEIWLDGQLIGYAPSMEKATRILSNERLARATHQHITYDDLQVMRAAGTFGEYVRHLDDEGLSSVAHMLVAANHAAGNMLDFDAVHARLAGIRANAVQAAQTIAPAEPVQVLIVAEYANAVEQIIIRRGYRGEVLHFCDTWTEAQEYMQSIGAR